MMHCPQYEKYELGKMTETDFHHHAEGCETCRRLLAADTELMASVRDLEPPASPWLWTRIEAALEEEASQARAPRGGFRWIPALRLAVVLGLGILIGVTILPRRDLESVRLLGDSAIRRVDRMERSYMNAIADLEARTEPVLAEMDLDLMLLYRDRMVTIDAQIERCREAMSENSGNAHIRKYLLAALQDKKETLREILDS